MSRRVTDGVDFQTYRSEPSDLHSGWNWSCLRCTCDNGRGWRMHRVDARRDARTHVATCEEPSG